MPAARGKAPRHLADLDELVQPALQRDGRARDAGRGDDPRGRLGETGELEFIKVYGNSHYTTPHPTLNQAVKSIKEELKHRLVELERAGRAPVTVRDVLPAVERHLHEVLGAVEVPRTATPAEAASA